MIIKPHRRLFLTGLAAGIVSPCIVKAENLMQIYNPDNKMVVAFRYFVGEDPWAESCINGLSFYTSDVFDKLKGVHDFNHYSLQRRGDVRPQPQLKTTRFVLTPDGYREISKGKEGYIRDHRWE